MTASKTTTPDLIAQLAAAPVPAAFVPVRAGVALGAAVCLGVALYLWSMGPRPGLIAALLTPVSLAKTALPLLLFALALPLALRLSRPGAPAVLWPFAVAAALAGVLLIGAGLTTPSALLIPTIIGQTAVKCLTSILTLSALPILVGVILLRRGASTRPVLSGAMIGLAAGAGAAAGYALSCSEDSPLFYVTWYGAAISLATGIGAVIGSRLLRW